MMTFKTQALDLDLNPIAAKELLRQPSTYILDVRTPQEFRVRALEGATLIPIDQLAQRLSELPEDLETPILVYCAHGVRSLSAQQILLRRGYSRVFNLRGGLANF